MDVDAVLGGLYELIDPHLTEKPRGLLAGAAARALGRGGGARMARISGLSRPTVYAGVWELDAPSDPQGRIRRPGGGPRRLVERQPGLLAALDELVFGVRDVDVQMGIDPDGDARPLGVCDGGDRQLLLLIGWWRHAPAGRADSTATGLGAQARIRSRSPGWWHLW